MRTLLGLALLSVAVTASGAEALEDISDVRVKPMVGAKWYQEAFGGDRAFELYSPNNYPCGCVVTAFIELMRYWRAPAGGVSKATCQCWVDRKSQNFTMFGGPYNWDLMPLEEADCTTAEQREALGMLAYDFSVATHTSWGQWSGTFGVLAADAIVQNFGYAFSRTVDNVNRNYSTRKNIMKLIDFRNAILASLDAGMPVVIGILSDTALGHQAVIDGYGFNGGSDVYCHLNFGLKGEYDGWYNLIADEITEHFQFTSINGITYNIHPSEVGDVISGRVLDSNGNPAANVKVKMKRSGAADAETVSGENGVFSFRFTGKGKFVLSAEDATLGRASRTVNIDKAGENIKYVRDGSKSFEQSLGVSADGVVANRWGEDLVLSASGGGDPEPVDPSPVGPEPVEPSGDAFVATAAAVFDGFFTNSTEMAGTVQFKVGKADKKTGASKVTATAILASSGKKLSYKGVMEASGNAVLTCSGQPDINVFFGKRYISGTFGSAYSVAGARSLFSSKDKAEQKEANDAADPWIGTINMICGEGTVSVSIAKKGKVKASCVPPDGKKASATGQLVCAEDGFCIPVVFTKNVNMSFTLMLGADGISVGVDGVPGAIVGKAGDLKNGAAFGVDANAELWKMLPGPVMDAYLPTNMVIKVSGSKWELPKAGKVAMKKGVLDDSKAGLNPSGLKLSYKAKDGSFKGSFKAYYNKDGSMKAVAVTVSGVMVNGVGYGTASVKKTGSAEVTVK